jgi:hypothetical protein
MTAADPPRLIEVKVQTLHQLFNSMDPSPFHERDLDHDAEQFILSWAQEYPLRLPLKLVVHLGQKPEAPDSDRLLAESIHNYFAYRYELNLREFRRLMREGWTSLIIGLGFLTFCVAVAQTVASRLGGWHPYMREGLTILGWVAMWRPLDIYLYRWWPLRHLGKVYRKLSEMPVEIRSPST